MSTILEMQIDELQEENDALKALNQKLQLEKNALKEQLVLYGVVKSLKDKETISFEDWKKRHIIDNDISGNYLHESEGWVKGNDLIKMYKREQNL